MTNMYALHVVSPSGCRIPLWWNFIHEIFLKQKWFSGNISITQQPRWLNSSDLVWISSDVLPSVYRLHLWYIPLGLSSVILRVWYSGYRAIFVIEFHARVTRLEFCGLSFCLVDLSSPFSEGYVVGLCESVLSILQLTRITNCVGQLKNK